ncbi:chromosomal replication initiator protein DnaA [bacterium]|nr:chromosomal replication initiator protein DnaA [bacterium]
MPPRVDARAIWQAALSALALQMPTATYETWVRDTSVIAYEDGEFIVGTPNPYARDWLANRLQTPIKRILGKLLNRSVQVTFRVRVQTRVEDATDDLPPLYRPLEPMEPRTTQAPARAEATGPRRALAPQQQNRNVLLEKDREERAQRLAEHTGGADNTAQAGTPVTNSTPWNQNAWQPSDPNEDAVNRSWAGKSEVHSTPLNPRYTFESFVVGSHNRLAHAAALSVADHPGQRFNPLFVYGGVGLGKTHLLHAIGNQMLTDGLQVLYCSSEQFTNDLISAIRSQSTEEFRNKYRQVDLLLIDDIQFIGGKESTQEEFFHTFNHLHAAGRQVVISSDRPPKEIATLEARLRSRFEGGLQADISQPDLETRVAILQTKAAQMKTAVPMDVLMLIAERVESNIRELEGALNRLIVQAPLYEGGVNRQAAEEILNNLMPQRRPREATSVVELVADYFRLTVADLTGRTRTKEVAYARQVAMYLLREENGLSLPAIGGLLGGRDHSTVRYGVEKVETDLIEDDELRRHLQILREKVYAPPASR